jgi:hypothetical protein
MDKIDSLENFKNYVYKNESIDLGALQQVKMFWTKFAYLENFKD